MIGYVRVIVDKALVDVTWDAMYSPGTSRVYALVLPLRPVLVGGEEWLYARSPLRQRIDVARIAIGKYAVEGS